MSELFCGVLVPGTFVTGCQLSAGHSGAHRVGGYAWSLSGEEPVVSAPAVDPVVDDVVARAKAALVGVTDGPWVWSSPRYGPPDLMGRAGDPEVHVWDTEVLEVSHDGGCGCRRGCELEVTLSDADRVFIAAARDLVPELAAEVERLRLAADGPGRYDWMAEELVAMAREMSGGDGVRGAQNQFVAAAILSVAQYVSASKGSGRVLVGEHL